MIYRYRIHFLYDYVFAHMVLPNALITEYGIINYLHSLYSNKLRNDCFTDPKHINSSQLLFDNNLGRWPNSLRQNGSHLKSHFYSEYLDYCEDSLYFGKKKTNKYVYPIKITPFMDEFSACNLSPANKLTGEYFWKHMSMEALQDARHGKALIFLDYAQENFIEREVYLNLHESLRNSGIPKEQILLAFNSLNAQEVYESWFSPDERRLEVRNWPYVMMASSFHYVSNQQSRMTEQTFLSTSSTLRKNHFLFKIRNTRPHRLALLFKLASDGLLEKGDWSCLTQIHYDNSHISHIANRYKFDLNLPIIEQLHRKLPHVLQSETNIKHSDVSAWTDAGPVAHLNSYFYICTETYVHGEYQSLTEKVFKPIINFQPFLFVAYPNALRVIRDLGFKTFDPYIDESYDDEKDEATRINLIYREISRLCSMDLNELHEWYWSMQDILIHNHRHMLELYKHDVKGPELIKYLYEKTIS